MKGPVGCAEPLKDVARNLERWVQGIVARMFSQSTVEELAHWSSAPVINALSDLYHPCQALADVFTLRERFGELRGLKLAFVGDGNNVAHSLMLTAVRLGMDFAICHARRDTAPNADIVAQAEGLAAVSGARLTSDQRSRQGRRRCARGLYRCVDQHGPEKESAKRRKQFAGHQVNGTCMALARPDAVFMHCLPAKRGEEVTDEVMESAASIVFDQAENRLHAQKALLLMMLR